MKLILCLTGLLTTIASCKSLDIDNLEVLESLYDIPQGWTATGRPEAERRIPFKIALHAQDEDRFHQVLQDVSNPFHEKYGQHISKLEMRDLVKPAQESTKNVISWLRQSGIPQSDITEAGDWIKFTATVQKAERMLNATFKTYQNDMKTSITSVRTLEYSVPSELHDHIDFISPTTRFTQIHPQFSSIHDTEVIGSVGNIKAVNFTSCNTSITPDCLRELYNIKGYTPSSNPEASGFLGVNGFLEQYARFADLTKFISTYAPQAAGANFSWTSVKGGLLDQNAANDSTEANLDIQYTVSLSYPLHNNFYSTAGRGILIPDLDQPSESDNQNEPYLEFFEYLTALEDDELPHTLSTSYGEDEQSVPAAYSQKVCNMIGALGGRGVSVIFSSGDTGVGSACQTNDGKNTTRFLPIFPASCPYVTSVGGTYQIPERAISFSSGGFSDRWAQPWYQQEAVDGYLSQLGDRWKGLYNPTGRGFPDVAAQSSAFRVVEKGRVIGVGGTSAAAPAFAAIIGLLNSARVEVGNRPLGFLNPWLYKVAAPYFNDITTGGSTGCTGEDSYSGLPAPFVEYASWNATKGWDPATGIGTPDFSKLLKLVKQGKVNAPKGPGNSGGGPEGHPWSGNEDDGRIKKIVRGRPQIKPTQPKLHV